MGKRGSHSQGHKVQSNETKSTEAREADWSCPMHQYWWTVVKENHKLYTVSKQWTRWMDGWRTANGQINKTFTSPLLLLKLCFFCVYVTVNYEINAVNRYSLIRVHPSTAPERDDGCYVWTVFNGYILQ